jgi:hypothetical protein
LQYVHECLRMQTRIFPPPKGERHARQR